MNRLLLIDFEQSDIKKLLTSANQLTNHWGFIDIIGLPNSVDTRPITEGNVTVHASSSRIIKFFWPVFVFKKGLELFLKNKYDHILVREHPLLLSCAAVLLLHKITDKPYVVEIDRPQSSKLLEKIEKFLMLNFFRFEAKFAKAILTSEQADSANFVHQCSKQSGKVICLPNLSNNNNSQEKQYPKTYGATLKQLFI